MTEEYLKIIHDSQTKTWKSVNYPYADFVKRTVGEQCLKSLRSTDANKVIDYFYDSQIGKTAKEVYEQSIVIAVNLQRLGVRKGDIVVLFSMNNEWILVLTLGCILIGAVPNFFEVRLDEVSSATIIDILQPTAVLYEVKYLSQIHESLALSKLDKKPLLISINSPHKPNVQNDLLRLPGRPIDFDNFKSVEIQDPQQETVLLALTSGSTGLPKIVQLTHALIMNGAVTMWDTEVQHAPMNCDPVVLSFSPIRWISQILLMLRALVFGWKRVSSCGANTGKYGLQVLRDCEITHIFGPPSIFCEILLQLDENDRESFSSLKMIQVGGESCPPVVMDMLRKHAINAKVFYTYGMTEMGSLVTNDEHLNGGKLLHGYELQILDDNMNPVGVNQPGQIAIKPPFPLKGYMAVENDKYYNERGLFINGDYGLVDDQNKFHILCRYKDLIRANGEVIVPDTLEFIVMNLPEVYMARIVGYRKTSNDPNEIGAFFVVLNSNVSITPSEISATILNILRPHISPKQLAIIHDTYIIDSMPVNASYKVDRVALKKLALGRAQM